jgi:hypothetical protein
MTSDLLPADGPALVGPVPLPPGRRIMAGSGPAAPVAWATSEPLADAGLAWQALTDLHPQTGLIPVLLRGLDHDDEPGWHDGLLGDPADTAQLSRMDAAVVLAREWDGVLPPQDEDDGARYPAEQRAPFGRRFPGLAPAGESPLAAAELRDVLTAIPACRLALVAASRPADVLPLIGWAGVTNRWGEATPAAAVLRSWEVRFGARLLQAGDADLTVLAARPPRDLAAALQVAAEHRAFCDECGGDGLVSVGAIGARLLATPLWSFRWDQAPGGR